MATLKEFEEALRQHGMTNALAILDGLKKRDRERRSIAPARRVVGRKMTADLARSILELHATTGMTQQEIAFKLGVNQGRVNEVIKRGKWLNADPHAPEALSRDKAMQRLDQRAKARRSNPAAAVSVPSRPLPDGLLRPIARQDPEKAASERPSAQPDVVRLAGRAVAGPTTPATGILAAPAPRPPLRPATSGPRPIVSAQLAFLDL